MAGKLTISTLNDSTGVLATQNGMTGIAKAWVNWDGVTLSGTNIRGSFNVSSITRVAAGKFVVNYATAMPNANYAAIVSSGNSLYDSVFAKIGCFSYPPSVTTTSCTVVSNNGTLSLFDENYYFFAVLGA